jgi:hypothetical protein
MSIQSLARDRFPKDVVFAPDPVHKIAVLDLHNLYKKQRMPTKDPARNVFSSIPSCQKLVRSNPCPARSGGTSQVAKNPDSRISQYSVLFKIVRPMSGTMDDPSVPGLSIQTAIIAAIQSSENLTTGLYS